MLESLFNKVVGQKACNKKETIKKRNQHRCFLVNIAKFLRTPILKNICYLLLLILQVMYARDFRASILAYKNYKINTKTLKILVFLPILFFSVFRLLRLFTFCSHATKFFFSRHICSFILYINIEINNLQCKNRIL